MVRVLKMVQKVFSYSVPAFSVTNAAWHSAVQRSDWRGLVRLLGENLRLRLGVYRRDQFDQLVDLILRKPDNQFNSKRLLSDIKSLLRSEGHEAVGTEAEMLWHTFAEGDLTIADLAKFINHMAEAPNPLDASLCPPNVRPYVNACFRRHLESKWLRKSGRGASRVGERDWSSLSLQEQADIRHCLTELTNNLRHRIHPGAPRKNSIDTLLFEVANVWIEQSGCEKAELSLPYSRNSRFIQFAAIVLAPFGHGTEVSKTALSRRWARILLPKKAD